MNGLALFDLDHTLLLGDSDYLWNCYMIQHALVKNPNQFQLRNDEFYESYRQGQLDIISYQRFQLTEMAKIDPQTLVSHRQQFIQTQIQPIVLIKALRVVQQHRQQNHTLVMITATNSFVTEPIAALFGIEHLIATEPQWINGRLTGDIMGIPCYQHGKVIRTQAWIDRHQSAWHPSWFYSDSHNDIPLLSRVDVPIAVNPDPVLTDHAQKHDWQIVDFHP